MKPCYPSKITDKNEFDMYLIIHSVSEINQFQRLLTLYKQIDWVLMYRRLIN